MTESHPIYKIRPMMVWVAKNMDSGLGYQDQHHLLVKISTRLHLLFHYV